MIYLYLHGFNSDGEGWKAQAIRRHFPQAEVWAPNLPARPVEVVQLLNDLLTKRTEVEVQVIGSSLGGFYAYYCSAVWGLPALLVNPSLSPHETLRGRGIGHFETWTLKRPYHFKASYLTELAELKEAIKHRVTPELLRFRLATDDDVLNFEDLPKQFPASDIRWYTGAGHSFSKFEKVLREGKREGWLKGS